MRTNVNVKTEANKIPFSDLKYGDYFLINSGLWIHLDTFTFPNDDDIDTTVNAVCLEDSTVDYFSGDTMVTFVKNVDITFSV